MDGGVCTSGVLQGSVTVRTKDEFIARFRLTLAGLALTGLVEDQGLGPAGKAGPLRAAERVWAIPEDTVKLLEAMWDYVAKDEPKPLPVKAPSPNGPQRGRT
jgi:hypothetical protein